MIRLFTSILLASAILAVPTSVFASCKLLTYFPPSSSTTNQGAVLNAVSVINADDVWALGTSFYGNYSTDVLHYNGSTWSLIPAPPLGSGTLGSIKAQSDTDVWVAGSVALNPTSQFITVPVIEHWNGTTWTVAALPSALTSSPDVAYSVSGILVLGPYIWATIEQGIPGPQFNAFGILEFNGSRWELDRMAAIPNTLWVGITGTNLNNIFAAAQYFPNGSSYIRHWNPKHFDWDAIPSPIQGTVITSMSARTSKDLWILTNSSSHLYQHWNGSSWSIGSSLPVPVHTGLVQVAVNPTWGYTWFLGNIDNDSQGVVELYDQVRGLMYDAVKSPAVAGYQLAFTSLDPIPSSNEAWIVGSAAADDDVDWNYLAEKYSCTK